MQSPLARPRFARLKQPCADALIGVSRADADNDVHTVVIAAELAAVSPQPADELPIIFGQKRLLVITPADGRQTLAFLLDGGLPLAGLQHHESGFVIELPAQGQKGSSVLASGRSNRDHVVRF